MKADMPRQDRRQRRLGRLAAAALVVLTLGRDHAAADRQRRLDFRTDTAGMGLRFTERIRSAWRRRWLRLHR